MKYYIIAGEASGDLHGANLMSELKKLDNNADFRFWGGDLMKQQGGTLVKHYNTLAFMGLYEVIMNITSIFRNFKLCKKDILSYNPDVVIFIDYPGFNLRMAKFVKQKKFRVFYYISPTIWAWHKSRIKTIKKYVDRMFVILPFEKEFYQKHNYEVEYYGHPLIDELAKQKKKPDYDNFIKQHRLPNIPIIALMPGSRVQEIEKILPEMLKTTLNFPQYQFVICGTTSIKTSVYENHLIGSPTKIIFNSSYEIILNSVAAIVKSGTSTLETALLSIPQVVCYKTSWLTYTLAKILVNLKYISLVNLIMKQEIVCELIQDDCNSKEMTKELNKILKDTNHKNEILKNYDKLKNLLGNGETSKKIAESMILHLK